MLAACGDGYLHTKGTPPLEECDDGDLDPGDGCDGSCILEPLPGCGNGVVDSLCTTGTVGATCAVNADCDVTLGDGTCVVEECDDANNSKRDDCIECRDAFCGDGEEQTQGTPPYEDCDDGNQQNGDGCNLLCEDECGNGAIDGACSALSGGFGPDTPCVVDADCDDPPLSGNGTCIAEPCDIGTDGLCLLTPVTCSSECTIAECGNEDLECDEQCDLGAQNGVLGSGCTIDCKRNVVGGRELTSQKECPAAWTLDNAPQDLRFIKQTCADGEACDFDAAANGTCVFSVGVCLNRPQPAGCAPGSILAVDLVGVKAADDVQADAAEIMALGMIPMITPEEAAECPNRCSAGERFKNCTNAVDCDSYLGANDGVCDVPTGVAYDPPLTLDADLPVAPNQAAACSDSQLVSVPVNDNLRMRLFARRTDGMRGDRDTIRLFCVP
jgi:cysteine-rich repeat protein